MLVAGPVDEETGYLCSIKALDALLYAVAVPPLSDRSMSGSNPLRSLVKGMLDVCDVVGQRCPAPAVLDWLELELSPYLKLRVVRGDSRMVRLTRSFEFSAAHRLYCEDFSDEENLRIFGKCSNPHGHGHNYVLEVTVGGTPTEIGTVIDPPLLDRIVNERVIQPFDHKNLNIECDDFKALNPSVENIARVIWGRLAGVFESCRLLSVRVWETPKTYAEYAGGD
jgi:6-pyruvoyltetrahydropterin/6-carboxytetrahydropterin synthase